MIQLLDCQKVSLHFVFLGLGGSDGMTSSIFCFFLAGIGFLCCSFSGSLGGNSGSVWCGSSFTSAVK